MGITMAGQHHAPMSAGTERSKLATEMHSAFFSCAASSSESTGTLGTKGFASPLIARLRGAEWISRVQERGGDGMYS
jgi:hypothetical protein